MGSCFEEEGKIIRLVWDHSVLKTGQNETRVERGGCDNPGEMVCGLDRSNGRGVGEEGSDFKFTSKVKMKAFVV